MVPLTLQATTERPRSMGQGTQWSDAEAVNPGKDFTGDWVHGFEQARKELLCQQWGSMSVKFVALSVMPFV